MTKLRPLFDKVLIKRVDTEHKTAGGIIIPDTAQEKTQTGAVISIGSGKMLPDGSNKAMQVKEGDRVMFGKYSGTEFKIDGTEYLILKEEEILGVLE
jgi:chaperonin GroES